MHVSLIDPVSQVAFPHLQHGGRWCYAVPAGVRFAVRINAVSSTFRGDGGHSAARVEHVVAVDGRDTLTNDDASTRAGGIISSPTYVCKGFRIGDDGVREFVCATLGEGTTTAERNGTASCAGLVSAVAYAERQRPRPDPVPMSIFRGAGGGAAKSRGIVAIRGSFGSGGETGGSFGGGMSLCSNTIENRFECTASAAVVVGPSAGAAAGAFVTAPVTRIEWKRGETIGRAIIEYDTPEGWAARGVVFPSATAALTRDPWPGDARQAARHCDPQTL